MMHGNLIASPAKLGYIGHLYTTYGINLIVLDFSVIPKY